jgi:hypothetical protein
MVLVVLVVACGLFWQATTHSSGNPSSALLAARKLMALKSFNHKTRVQDFVTVSVAKSIQTAREILNTLNALHYLGYHLLPFSRVTPVTFASLRSLLQVLTKLENAIIEWSVPFFHAYALRGCAQNGTKLCTLISKSPPDNAIRLVTRFDDFKPRSPTSIKYLEMSDPKSYFDISVVFPERGFKVGLNHIFPIFNQVPFLAESAFSCLRIRSNAGNQKFFSAHDLRVRLEFCALEGWMKVKK